MRWCAMFDRSTVDRFDWDPIQAVARLKKRKIRKNPAALRLIPAFSHLVFVDVSTRCASCLPSLSLTKRVLP